MSCFRIYTFLLPIPKEHENGSQETRRNQDQDNRDRQVQSGAALVAVSIGRLADVFCVGHTVKENVITCKEIDRRSPYVSVPIIEIYYPLSDTSVGSIVGAPVGTPVGTSDGCAVGEAAVGSAVGSRESTTVGS